MTVPAIRTVSETPDIHVIEGYAYPFRGPFRGKDSYGTRFSARTNFYWDLFPDSESDPKFIRPLNYQHGFDSEVGLSRTGGWTPVRTDGKGVWVQAQLDKHHAYYSAIRELLDKDALSFSGESAEHSVRIAADGEVMDWPAYALALTPTPSNPFAAIAARTAATAEALVRIVEPGETPAVSSPSVRTIQTFSDIVASAEMDDELPEAFDTLRSAIYCAIWATDAEFNPVTPEEKQAAIQTSLDQFRDYVLGIMDKAARSAQPAARAIPVGTTPFYFSVGTQNTGIRETLTAVRAGARNSAADQKRVDTIHDAATDLGASAHAQPTPPNDESNQEPDTGADAARSAEALPTISIVERPDAAALRAELLATASTVGTETAKRLTRTG